jgi:hypothetical protein
VLLCACAFVRVCAMVCAVLFRIMVCHIVRWYVLFYSVSWCVTLQVGVVGLTDTSCIINMVCAQSRGAIEHAQRSSMLKAVQ